MRLSLRSPRVFLGAVLIACCASLAKAEDPYRLSWIRQLGSSAEEQGLSLAVGQASDVYVAGFTMGRLGAAQAGNYDAFLCKYGASGNLVWVSQFGTSSEDQGRGVAADGAGNAYVTGYTAGNLGGPKLGGYDMFIRKYAPSGTALWTRQLGTLSADKGYGVATDSSGSLYVCGDSYGVLEPGGSHTGRFLSRYDATGNLVWVRQPAGGYGLSTATDRFGNIYMAGDIGWMSSDASLCKYDAAGNLLWDRHLGTMSYTERAEGVAVDAAGNVYVTGCTYGDLIHDASSSSAPDAFLAKYDTSGSLLWLRQFGSRHSDFGNGVAVDPAGSVFVCGYTVGDLGGPSAGHADAFLSKFDVLGNQLWCLQFGTAEREFGEGVALDGFGNLYVCGCTEGNLGGTGAGGFDVFVARFEVPEPATLSLLILGAAGMFAARRRAARRRRVAACSHAGGKRAY